MFLSFHDDRSSTKQQLICGPVFRVFPVLWKGTFGCDFNRNPADSSRLRHRGSLGPAFLATVVNAVKLALAADGDSALSSGTSAVCSLLEVRFREQKLCHL